MVNIFGIRKRMLERSLEKQKAKTAKFNVKQGKVKEIEALHKKIASQKTSRKLTPTQIARRAKIKSNTKKALVGFGNLVSAAVKEANKKPKSRKKKTKGRAKKNDFPSFFD